MHRKDALAELCDTLQIKHKCLPYDSEFYRAETRKESLSKVMQDISDSIDEFKYDYIFTHNVLGEYGHLDHQLVHQVVMQKGVPTIVTDIFIKSNWCPYEKMSDNYKMIYQWQPVQKCVNNLVFYLQCQSIYMKHKVWTWSKPPVPECNMFRIKKPDQPLVKKK